MSEVASGKAKVKFVRRMKMSPGRRPSQGMRGATLRARPMSTKETPATIRNFPTGMLQQSFRSQPQMLGGIGGGFAAARGAAQEPGLEQERLHHIRQGIGLFIQRRRQRL